MRPGRTVELLSASLSDGDAVVIRASAWRFAAAEIELPGEAAGASPPAGRSDPAGPQQAREERALQTLVVRERDSAA